MTNNPYEIPHFSQDVFKCAIIDSQGKEIPITDQMITQACEALESTQQNYYLDISKPNADK